MNLIIFAVIPGKPELYMLSENAEQKNWVVMLINAIIVVKLILVIILAETGIALLVKDIKWNCGHKPV
jgi:hypothetical protein